MKKVTEHSAENMLKEVKVNAAKWNKMPSDQEIAETAKAIESRGIKVILVEDSAAALKAIAALIPKGAEVMNGSSTTLAEIGFMDLLKDGTHGWKNLHDNILKEKDPVRQGDLRRSSLTAEYFISSVNAIAKTGELVACDASGSRVGAFPFAAKNLILVSGVNKITPSLPAALDRIRKYAFPLENLRAQKAYGMGSMLGKFVILSGEMFKGRTTLILVKESLGY